ncbi:exonuclease domain-containing protein [Bacillus sp. Brlt_9]|uniref:exonuclease domain-containing protein n=1 Tax=Bacillus sp. Brlt_9 TaxID=3110916 RepID=UPI003F7BA0AB
MGNYTISDIISNNKSLKNAEIEVEVIELNYRSTKNGSLIIDGVIYDKTSSMYLSYFDDVKPDYTVGDIIKLKGSVAPNKFKQWELTFKPNKDGIIKTGKRSEKIYDDGSEEHRVELQTFSFMTAKRGAVPVKKYFETAKALGHKAIAITDLGVAQGFPEAYSASKKTGVKAILGMTALMVPETVLVYNDDNRGLTKDIVVYDVETTGFSARNDYIIEVGAVKISNGKVVSTFQKFVKSPKKINGKIESLTGITNEMLDTKGEEPANVLQEFKDFVGDAMLAAHNAWFDLYMLEAAYDRVSITPPKLVVIDTLKVSRKLNHSLKSHRLSALAKKYGVSLKNAHRACDDAEATAKIFIQMVEQLKEEGIYTTSQLVNYKKELDVFIEFPDEMTLWVKNKKGLKNLYNIISESHINNLSKMGSPTGSNRPMVSWELLNKYREGIIVGSGSHLGRLFNLALEKPDHLIEQEIQKYDVIEIQPAEISSHLWHAEDPKTDNKENISKAWETIYKTARKYNKFVVASSHSHYIDEEESLLHNILIYSQLPPKREHKIRKGKMDFPFGLAHLRTTKEMLNAFPYLSKEEAEKVVIENTNIFADQIEEISPIPLDEKGNPELFTPKIDGIDDKFRELAMENALKTYGNPLPDIVEKRLKRELDSIISNGYAVIYMISRDLVKKSLEDGYLVGSRGSVGSSLAATMTEITEVNPLPPHYVCKNCCWSIFFENEELQSGFDLPYSFKGLLDSELYTKEAIDYFVNVFMSSFDVEDREKIIDSMKQHNEKVCPKCKEKKLFSDGQNIQFETFLGFDGDKVPDIDLNFSSVYQNRAHLYTKVLFGEENVFRAGTIGTVAENTAFASVRNYYKNHEVLISKAEISRLSSKINGSGNTTGSHPGGILVCPSYMDMTDIAPYQYPANDPEVEFRTSHFDFHSIHDNILKLDILGHDAPTLLRYAKDYTGIDPRDVPPADPDVLKLFYAPEEVLGFNPKEIGVKTGTLGLPEMWTRVVQDVISETNPKTFGDLLTLSGLTHGTDVYYGNAQKLIADGTCTIREVIGCRDDIMRFLRSKGMNPSLAFIIMEAVRKGKGLTSEWEENMLANDVPDWYIWSCKLIKYMFPRAHAAAYVLDATRMGYYKLNYPIEFYASIMSSRYNDENVFEFLYDVEGTKKRMEKMDEEIKELEKNGEINPAKKLKRTRAAMNVVLEAKLRGIKFGKVQIYKSHSFRYLIDPETKELIPPFSSIDGIGKTVAQKLYEERKNGVFKGLKDLNKRTKADTSNIEALRAMGCLSEIEEIQPTLF